MHAQSWILNGSRVKHGRQSLALKFGFGPTPKPEHETSDLRLDARHFRIASRSSASAMPRQASFCCVRLVGPYGLSKLRERMGGLSTALSMFVLPSEVAAGPRVRPPLPHFDAITKS